MSSSVAHGYISTVFGLWVYVFTGIRRMDQGLSVLLYNLTFCVFLIVLVKHFNSCVFAQFNIVTQMCIRTWY